MKSRHILLVTIFVVAMIAITFAQPPPPPNSSSGRPRRSSSTGMGSTSSRPPRKSSSSSGTGSRSTGGGSMIIGSSTGTDTSAINAVPPVGPARVAAYTVIGVTAASALICCMIAIRRHRAASNARQYGAQHDDATMIQVEGDHTGDTHDGTHSVNATSVENSTNGGHHDFNGNGSTGDDTYTYVTPQEISHASPPSYPSITPLPFPIADGNSV